MAVLIVTVGVVVGISSAVRPSADQSPGSASSTVSAHDSKARPTSTAAVPPRPTVPTPTLNPRDPSMSARPQARVDIPRSGTGKFGIAPGTSEPVGNGREVTYSVEVEEGLPYSASAIARVVDRVLADRRGWTAITATRLRRAPTSSALRIRLATPETTDALCAPLETGGRLSCRNGEMVVLNAWRWTNGADAYRDDLRGYRTYLINHEVGHALGNGHRSCPGRGKLAPVMAQQTKGLDGCRPNSWPAVG